MCKKLALHGIYLPKGLSAKSVYKKQNVSKQEKSETHTFMKGKKIARKLECLMHIYALQKKKSLCFGSLCRGHSI